MLPLSPPPRPTMPRDRKELGADRVLPRRRRTRSSCMQPTLDSHQDTITELVLATEGNRFCVPVESRYIAPIAVRIAPIAVRLINDRNHLAVPQH